MKKRTAKKTVTRQRNDLDVHKYVVRAKKGTKTRFFYPQNLIEARKVARRQKRGTRADIFKTDFNFVQAFEIQ